MSRPHALNQFFQGKRDIKRLPVDFVTPQRKSMYVVLLRVLIGLILVWLLIQGAGLSRVASILATINPYWLVMAFVVQLVAKFVWASRWSLLLVAFDMPIAFLPLVKAIFVGLFFSNFLPTSYGGDFYRAYWVLDDQYSYKRSIFIIFLERLFGFASIGFIALPAFVFFLANDAPISATNLMLLMLLMGLCGSALILHPEASNSASRLANRIDNEFMGRPVRKISDALMLLQEAKMPTWRVIGYSLLVHLSGILFFYCLGQGMGLEFEGWHYLIIVPVTMVATMLPLSLNGLGIREGVLVLLAATFAVNVSPSQAIALGLMSAIVAMLVSIIGGVFYATGRRPDAGSA